jgi:threonine dehydrogenase-like Zn-dependent dehydrogenase
MCENQMPAIYGMSAHGAHAPYLTVPAQTLVPLPEELSFLTGSAIACGVGTAYGALMRVNPSGRDTVAVFGQGPVGLGVTQLASALGARVIALDVNPARLALAEKLGADATVNPAETSATEAITELTRGRGADYVVETSGAVSARTEGVNSLRPWGSIVLVAGGTPLSIDNVSLITSRQLTIMGSWTFSNTGQAACTRFIAERDVPVDSLFTHTWALDQADEAYRVFGEQSAGKAAFVF